MIKMIPALEGPDSRKSTPSGLIPLTWVPVSVGYHLRLLTAGPAGAALVSPLETEGIALIAPAMDGDNALPHLWQAGPEKSEGMLVLRIAGDGNPHNGRRDAAA